MKAKNALSLLLAAGVVTPAIADVTPEMSRKGFESGAVLMGHIYVNVATGEKIATRLVDGRMPTARGGEPAEVWMNDNDVPCADVDAALYTVAFVGLHDDPGAGANDDELSSFLNWGDMPADTVIDAIQVTTYANHADVDLDGDGLADGVEGLACVWTFLEGDNGFNSCDTRLGLVGVGLVGIGGNLGNAAIEGYIYTIDLVGFGGDDLSFEIGDTDGNLQNAAVHNALANANGELDLDADGLVDFAYTIQYIQPGRLLDDQGNPIGDPNNRARTFTGLSAPRGTATCGPRPGNFTIDATFPGGSAGSEDAFDVLIDPLADGSAIHSGTFWYGGFTCDRDGDLICEGGANGTAAPNGPNDYRAWAGMFMGMFGGTTGPAPCRADLFPVAAGDGLLNFFDLSTFLGYYNTQNPLADFFPVAGGDGLFNFFDISTYISEFNAGCP